MDAPAVVSGGGPERGVPEVVLAEGAVPLDHDAQGGVVPDEGRVEPARLDSFRRLLSSRLTDG